MSTRPIAKPSFTSRSEINSAITPAPKPLRSFWRRFFHWETITVAGKTIDKGWVLPQPLGIALIVTILGATGTLWYRMGDRIQAQDTALHQQNELLIRLDQRLMDKQGHDDQRFDKLQDDFDLQKVYVGDLRDRVIRVESTKRKGG